MPAEPEGPRLLRRLPMESPLRAVLVTALVCAFCSAAVTTAVSLLRPYQQAHRTGERAARIQELLGRMPGLADLLGGSLAGERLEAHVVDLASGEPVPGADPATFDAQVEARDPELSVPLPPERDLAGIGRRPRRALAYLVSREGRPRLVVLPVYGAGYLSTLYGYVALDADGRTVRGLTFYEQGETPGLGSEIQNPEWLAQWDGKRVRDDTGAVRLGVATGGLRPGDPEAAFLVDGITGATRTGAGVTNLLRFWLGPDGFGPYLERLAREEGSS